MSFHTPLKKAKGLGSAKHGTGHWFSQKVTSVALIPLAIWFVVLLICIAKNPDESLVTVLSSPANAILILLFLGTSLHHGSLGMQVIIEDYVHKECSKIFLLTVIKYASIATIVALAVSVIAFLIPHLSAGITNIKL